MDTTEIIKHYRRIIPEIEHYYKDGDLLRLANYDFYGWYNDKKQFIKPTDTELLDKIERTLFLSLDFYKPEFFDLVKNGKETQGTYEDIQGFTLASDLDTKKGIYPFSKEALKHKEIAANFISKEFLKVAPNSVSALNSVGGVYHMIDHRVLNIILDKERDGFFFEIISRAFKMWLGDVQNKLYKKHPEVIKSVKIDCITNKKRVFKAPGSIHKKYDRAVTVLDVNEIKLTKNTGEIPLSKDELKKLKSFYTKYNVEDGKTLLNALCEYFNRVKKLMRKDRSATKFEILDVPIDVDDFAPCVKKILDLGWKDAPTRRYAFMCTLTGEGGWDKEKARNFVYLFGDKIGCANKSQIFKSYFRFMHVPSCETLKNIGGGFPGLSFGPDVCIPDNECNLIVNPIDYKTTIIEDAPELEGYVITKKAIFKESYDSSGDRKLSPVCLSAVKVVGRGRNVDSNEVFLKLVWSDINGNNKEGFFSQSDLYRKQGVMKLLPGQGVELIDNMAGGFIAYLVNYVAAYKDELTQHIITNKQGWKGKNQFVLGELLYTKEGVEEVLLNEHTERLKGVCARGDIEGWHDSISKLIEHPRQRLKIYAAASVPLLKVLQAKSFIIDDFGETTTGKTTTSEVAMSVYGNPDILTLTGNATAMGIEVMATTFCDLPVFFDETSATDEKTLSKIIYNIANETGRLRGQKDGKLRVTERWKSVALFTGETPIKKSGNFGGQTARVIEIYGGLGVEDLEAIDYYKERKLDNYGVIGPLLINKIISMPQDELIGKWKDIRTQLRKELPTRIEARIAETFSIIAVGGLLFEEILKENDLPYNKDVLEVVKSVFEETTTGLTDTNYLDSFLTNFTGWLSANENLFKDTLESVSESDSGERISTQDNLRELPGRITSNHVDIFPHKLKELCEKWKFDYDRVLRDLKKEGKTHCTHGNYYKSTVFGKAGERVIRFIKEEIVWMER